MSIYSRDKYVEQLERFKAMLGGKCVWCGATEALEFDHIDPRTKKFTISTGWALSVNGILEELMKCQLLCHDCHVKKTHKDCPKGHGNLTQYRKGCRCELCRVAIAAYARDYRNKRGISSNTKKRTERSHGEERMYQSGCRCCKCRRVHADRILKYKADKKAKLCVTVVQAEG